MFKELKPALKMLAVLTLITGVLYPLAVTGIAQVAFPDQANGSLVRDAGEYELARCRAVFGDERRDYGEALAAHYANGAPDDWQTSYVSSYATMHAWEDWAETWAHYLHMVDTLEMASAFGIRIAPDVADDASMDARLAFDPLQVTHVQRLVDAWLPLTYAVNSLNRAMGQSDLYPFVIAPAVIGKMAYIHDLIRQQRSRSASGGV